MSDIKNVDSVDLLAVYNSINLDLNWIAEVQLFKGKKVFIPIKRRHSNAVTTILMDMVENELHRRGYGPEMIHRD